MSTADYGIGLRPGDSHYRAYVGPPKDYDLIGGQSFSLLLAAGLRETHLLADLGCGSLRAGRLLIPYLRPGGYYGMEPNTWLVEAGIEQELGRSAVELKRPTFSSSDDFGLDEFGVEFDFVLAQSIFSHTMPDLLDRGFRGVAGALAPEGVLVATFVQGKVTETGTGWVYPECVDYTWADLQATLAAAGLTGFRIDWPHPRQRWFVAGHSASTSTALAIATSVRSSVRPV